jgi:hypothetical protein
MTNTREFKAWTCAKDRCYRPRYHNFRHYGGRGIAMAPEWRTSFERFYADLGPCPDGHSLDRIDNDGPYAPGNCRWASNIEQHRNTRRNLKLTFNGKTMTMTEWAAQIGVKKSTLHERLRNGWSTERALSAATAPYKRTA